MSFPLTERALPNHGSRGLESRPGHEYHLPMHRLVSTIFALLLSSCGGEAGTGGGEAEVASSNAAAAAPRAAEVETSLPFCIHTFQVRLMDNSGKAQVRVCLDAGDQTVEYLMRNRGFLDAIREACIEIVGAKSMDELEMPSGQTTIVEEMLSEIREQLDPLTVEGLELQRFETW